MDSKDFSCSVKQAPDITLSQRILIATSGVNGSDIVITFYETDSPVITTNYAGSTVVVYTKSTEKIPGTRSVEATPTVEDKDDVVAVFVTNCPVNTNAAGATIVSHTQSTVTSIVCTKCGKKAAETPQADTPKTSSKMETPKASSQTEIPKASPKVESPETDETIRLTQTLTHTLNRQPTAPAQVHDESIPAQANSASKAAAGAAVVVLPMVLAALL
ncbi:hypothetical protein BKA91DRAFT_159629 [Yarrowia lipolytica]|nr:hypothetical protein BKA91DRAFT_159629 [Yarrowia lipolytica]KAE8173003.1 hypothetical protein BKA90DRAFT_161846 [Yarrowia lipolytica]RMI96128.1 hypothetical protein BD777DRAFT_169656 [Yarrowia lipolytica]